MASIIQQQEQYSWGKQFVWVAPSNPRSCILRATICKAMSRNNHGGLLHWTIHDLRRTLITQMAELSVPLHVVEKVAGHELQGVLAVYNRYSYFDEQRDALHKWGERLRIRDNGGDNVRLFDAGYRVGSGQLILATLDKLIKCESAIINSCELLIAISKRVKPTNN